MGRGGREKKTDNTLKQRKLQKRFRKNRQAEEHKEYTDRWHRAAQRLRAANAKGSDLKQRKLQKRFRKNDYMERQYRGQHHIKKFQKAPGQIVIDRIEDTTERLSA